MPHPSSSHQPPSSPTLQTFHSFRHLPTELRLKIWHHFLHLTTPPPISIIFNPRGGSSDNKPQVWVADDSILHKGRPIPVILHVNSEARAVGLEKYVPGFEVSEELRALPFNHCWKKVE